jgi:hypothetical protein
MDGDLGKSVRISSDQGIYAYEAYFIVCGPYSLNDVLLAISVTM